MHPLPENVAWEDYLQSVKQITNEAYPAAYEVVIDGVIQYTVTISDYRNLSWKMPMAAR